MERPPVGIDPRIRRRRVEVRRDEGRRRLRLLVGTAAVASIIAGGWGLTRSPLMALHHVRLVGAGHTPASDVVAAGRLRSGEALADLDLRASARRIEGLPWVDRALVRRRWPQTVTVTISERTAVATVAAASGGWASVDRTGRVLAVTPTPPPGMVVLERVPPPGGPGSHLDDSAAAALAVAAALPAPLAARIGSVAPRQDTAVELSLRSGGVVLFGGPDQLADKLTALATILARVDTRDLAVLDVRVPSSPVVSRRKPAGA
ncbi:MAG: cell division protein FtsQ/DivIB [Acidimicrobiales bacterium]